MAIPSSPVMSMPSLRLSEVHPPISFAGTSVWNTGVQLSPSSEYSNRNAAPGMGLPLLSVLATVTEPGIRVFSRRISIFCPSAVTEKTYGVVSAL